MGQLVALQFRLRNCRQQVFTRIGATISHNLFTKGEHVVHSLVEFEREKRFLHEDLKGVDQILRCHFQIVHPVNDFRPVSFIHTQHFAKGEKRYLLGKQFHEIDNRSLALHLVKQIVNLAGNAITNFRHIGRNEEIFLLDAHLHVVRCIEINQ